MCNVVMIVLNLDVSGLFPVSCDESGNGTRTTRMLVS